MNVAVRGDDERCIEVVASGLPLYDGAQLADALCCLELLAGDRCHRGCPGDLRAMESRSLGVR